MSGNHFADLFTYLVRHGDRSLVLAQRLSQWLTRAHELEEEMALGNIALDLLGQTRTLFTYAGEVEGRIPGRTARSEDDLAYLRSDREFTNPLLVELDNGDFARTMVRQLFHDVWADAFWDLSRASSDATLAALAGKAHKETAYHLRHSRGWVVRLGDGTDESHRRTQDAVDRLWRYTGELFETDEVEHRLTAAGVAPDMAAIEARWRARIDEILAEATLEVPEHVPGTYATGGRAGVHTEDFSYLIGELQVVARAHPGATW